MEMRAGKSLSDRAQDDVTAITVAKLRKLPFTTLRRLPFNEQYVKQCEKIRATDIIVNMSKRIVCV